MICRIGGQGIYELRAGIGATLLAYRQQAQCDQVPFQRIQRNLTVAMTASYVFPGSATQDHYVYYLQQR
jgi:hypothetical protein